MRLLANDTCISHERFGVFRLMAIRNKTSSCKTSRILMLAYSHNSSPYHEEGCSVNMEVAYPSECVSCCLHDRTLSKLRLQFKIIGHFNRLTTHKVRKLREQTLN
jgi:hypothetical protein